MRDLLQKIGRWLTRHVILLLVIIAMLVAVPYIKNEFNQFIRIIGELATSKSAPEELEKYFRSIEQDASERTKKLETTSLDALRSKFTELENKIQQSKRNRSLIGGSSLSIGKPLVDNLKRKLDILVLEHERDYLEKLISHLDVALNQKKAGEELERLRKVHAVVYAKFQKLQTDLNNTGNEGSWKCRVIIWTDECRRFRDLKKAYDAALSENTTADANYKRQKQLVDSTKLHELPVFNIPQDQKDKVLGLLREKIKESNEQYRDNWITKIFSLLDENLRPALLILLSIILLPIAIKVFFYFIVAPWSARRPPIRILPTATGNVTAWTLAGTAENRTGRVADVSQAIVLGEGRELLIQPEYFQSTPLHAKKETAWLLNAHFPFSSLLSGMFLLTRRRLPLFE